MNTRLERLRPWSTLLIGGVLAILTGCESAQPTARQESVKRWNDARADVKLKLAADQLNAGHLEDAANEIAAAERLDPLHPALLPLQARLCLAQGNLVAAEKLLRGAPAAAQNRGETEYLLGVLAEQRMRWEEALQHYVNAAEADSGEVAYVTAIVQLLLQQGKAADSLAALESYEAQFGWTGAYQAALAECYEQLGDWPRAVTAWRRVIAADSNADIRERLALALYRAGRWSEAVPQLRQVLEIPGQPLLTPLRLALADCCLQTNDPDSAHEQLGHVLRENPRDSGALRLQACAYARQNLFTQALYSAEQALLGAPDDRNTLEIAAALAYRAGKHDRAAVLARRLAQVSPDAANPLVDHILKAAENVPAMNADTR